MTNPQNDTGAGVVIFSFNTGDVDYLSLALYCAKRVKTYWGLPVSIITDTPFQSPEAACILTDAPSESSSRVYADFNKEMKFLNRNRASAWELSPYTKTIVIDSDFLVSGKQVLNAWGFEGLKLSKTAYTLSTQILTPDMTELSPDGLPMYWATIVCFDRSKASELFFKYWKMIVANYRAYSNLYGYNPGLIRNDFCVTIALDLLSQFTGSVDPFTLPYAIPTAAQATYLKSLTDIEFSVSGVDLKFFDTDVHVLFKKSLLALVQESSSCKTT